MKPFSIIAACDEQGGIGKENSLPWRLPGELQYFQKITTASDLQGNLNVVIMGRNTWEAIPEKRKPLKERINIVLSSQNLDLPPGVLQANSLQTALDSASNIEIADNIFIIGGGKVYADAINHPDCQKIFLTKISANFNCDVFFPLIDENRFQIYSASESQNENDLNYQFLIYEIK